MLHTSVFRCPYLSENCSAVSMMISLNMYFSMIELKLKESRPTCANLLHCKQKTTICDESVAGPSDGYPNGVHVGASIATHSSWLWLI